jgi:hypothetical protein
MIWIGKVLANISHRILSETVPVFGTVSGIHLLEARQHGATFLLVRNTTYTPPDSKRLPYLTILTVHAHKMKPGKVGKENGSRSNEIERKCSGQSFKKAVHFLFSKMRLP